MEIGHKFTPNNFKVSDFLSWQRAGTLDLQPRFQRRSVWKPGAKSYLIDSLHRGLPVPLVFLRDRLDLVTGETVREVVDGQQRLRTVLSYIDPTALPDFDAERDSFSVSKIHNVELGGKAFAELSDESRGRILSYQFSVQTLPDDMTERDILEVFARLNSTGQTLTAQELRNAAYFGAFKSFIYDLSYRYTSEWLRWGIFTPDQLSRMAEVEMASDLVYNILYGISGKSKARLDRMYDEFDSEFEQSEMVRYQFDTVMNVIEQNYGDRIRRSVFSKEVHFFSLFVYTYDVLFNVSSKTLSRKTRPLPAGFTLGLTEASRRFKELEVPPDVLDSVARASADYGRRKTRFEYLRRVIAEVS
jgi:hypothetical protein